MRVTSVNRTTPIDLMYYLVRDLPNDRKRGLSVHQTLLLHTSSLQFWEASISKGLLEVWITEKLSAPIQLIEGALEYSSQLTVF